MRVCIGGTFDILHKGHRYLISKAFETAGEQGYVFIGLTTGKIADRKGKINSFNNRKKAIQQYLQEEKITTSYDIKPIHDKYGPSTTEEFDAIIISPETKPTAEEINKIRRQNQLKPLKIIEIPFIMADDNKPVSSTRIRQKKINQNGHIF